MEICVLQWLQGDKRRQGKPDNAWTRLRLGSLTGTCCIHRIIRLFCAGEHTMLACSMFWGLLDWTICLLALSSQAGCSPNFRLLSFEFWDQRSHGAWDHQQSPWCLPWRSVLASTSGMSSSSSMASQASRIYNLAFLFLSFLASQFCLFFLLFSLEYILEKRIGIM